MTGSKDYCGIAAQYCEDVLTGVRPACKWVKLACKRQVKDLKKFESNGLYSWNPEKAAKVCKFIESLTHVKGELAGSKIRLEPWQVFILSTVFGWERREDGGRRYRRVYIEVPRGNGKSCLSSGVALYCLLADKEPGAEVYSFATTRDQAKIVFNDAKMMVQGNAALKEYFGAQALANAVYVPSTNSTLQAKSAEGSTLDGLNTHFACIDELHAHKTRAVYDVVETSLGKRRSSLLWCITTAGFDLTGICFEQRTMCSKVLEGAIKDETQFAIIFTIDADDDWKTEAALEKANPNWGVSVRPEMITSLQAKAKELPSATNNFLTKHLDVWCNANTAWLPVNMIDACMDESLNISDFEGEDCWIGLDLASRVDIAAEVKLFKRMIDGKAHFYAFSDFFLPERAIETSPNAQYRGWATLDLIHTNEGAETSFAAIEDQIIEDCSRFSVREVPFDPFQAAQISQRLEAQNVPMVEYRATVQNFSDPMKSMEALIKDGRFHFNSPVLRWMLTNIVCHTDAKDNVYPRKERNENKIDGVVACIMALARANAEETEEESYDLDAFLDAGVTLRFS